MNIRRTHSAYMHATLAKNHDRRIVVIEWFRRSCIMCEPRCVCVRSMSNIDVSNEHIQFIAFTRSFACLCSAAFSHAIRSSSSAGSGSGSGGGGGGSICYTFHSWLFGVRNVRSTGLHFHDDNKGNKDVRCVRIFMPQNSFVGIVWFCLSIGRSVGVLYTWNISLHSAYLSCLFFHFVVYRLQFSYLLCIRIRPIYS